MSHSNHVVASYICRGWRHGMSHSDPETTLERWFKAPADEGLCLFKNAKTGPSRTAQLKALVSWIPLVRESLRGTRRQAPAGNPVKRAGIQK